MEQPDRPASRRWIAMLAVVVATAGVTLPLVTAGGVSATPLFSDYTVVQTVTIPAGTSMGPGVNEATADCSPADIAIGGGIDQGSTSGKALIVSDAPLIAKAEVRTFPIPGNNFSLHSPADGWEAEAVNYTSAAEPLTAYAVCDPPTGGAVGPTTVYATATSDTPMGPAVASLEVACPTGTEATGGGGDMDTPGAAQLEGTNPLIKASESPYGWTVAFNANSSAVSEFDAVICANQTGLAPLTSVSVSNVDADCPAGTEATGGGVTAPGSGSEELLDSLPLISGAPAMLGKGPVTAWRGTDAAAHFTVTALCVSTASSTTTTTTSTSTTSTTVASTLKPVTRLAGTDRIGTAIAVSQTAFPKTGAAKAVVLTRSDDFADALAGTPLAAAKDAPLLLTAPTGLDPRVASEIERVAPKGATVYLLGGPSALATSIDPQLAADGYVPVRLAGADRFATAVAIAHDGLGDPTKVLEATGLNFPDALSAGAAAGSIGAAVLLTDDTTQAAATATYLAAHPGDTRWAVGGQASAADPTATPLVGSDRYATSADVASEFFATPTTVGAALGTAFPDALSGGAQMAGLHGPLVLVQPSAPIPSTVASYLVSTKPGVTAGFLYGGTAVVGEDVRTAIAEAIS